MGMKKKKKKTDTFHSYINRAYTYCLEETELKEEMKWIIKSIAKNHVYQETDIQKLINKSKSSNKKKSWQKNPVLYQVYRISTI